MISVEIKYQQNYSTFDFGNGATAGLEYIFDNQGEFEWGIGAEYKFDQKAKG
jgi:OOP family OmpA-OmpF porin